MKRVPSKLRSIREGGLSASRPCFSLSMPEESPAKSQPDIDFKTHCRLASDIPYLNCEAAFLEQVPALQKARSIVGNRVFTPLNAIGRQIEQACGNRDKSRRR